ncbi:ATP-binding protein [Candidatus Berkelbacteria bacterium]|nr:ATP-binding protein [Candidatus Berkelbacteria bacterium]
MMRKIILITGAPASGKTSLAYELAGRLSVPLIARDTLKEHLFDVLGHSDRAWSQKLGAATFTLLYAIAEELLRGDQSFILESNFKSQAQAEFERLRAIHPFETFQIICGGDPDVLVQRFAQRHKSGERHPGHVDHHNLQTFLDNPGSGWYEPFNLPGEILKVDTTVFASVDHENIVRKIAAWLQVA